MLVDFRGRRGVEHKRLIVALTIAVDVASHNRCERHTREKSRDYRQLDSTLHGVGHRSQEYVPALFVSTPPDRDVRVASGNAVRRFAVEAE